MSAPRPPGAPSSAASVQASTTLIPYGLDRFHWRRQPNDPAGGSSGTCSARTGSTWFSAWTEAAALGAPGGRGAVVAVLDSGVAYERHGRYRRAPDLRHSTFIHPWDFIQRDRHPDDLYGHGTHVAGTIAQTTNNRIGTAGIAYNAKIMPLRVLDSRGEGDSAAIARAIRYAVRHHADVINLSLEFPAEVRSAEIPDVVSALHFARPPRRGRRGGGRQPDRHHRRVSRAREDASSPWAPPRSTAARPTTRTAATASTCRRRAAAWTRPTRDSVWDAAHCDPDTSGPPIVQQTFTSSIQRFGLPRIYKGTSMASPHVAAIAALLIATQAARAAPDSAGGRGAHQGDRAAHGPAGSLRRRARGRRAPR